MGHRYRSHISMAPGRFLDLSGGPVGRVRSRWDTLRASSFLRTRRRTHRESSPPPPASTVRCHRLAGSLCDSGSGAPEIPIAGPGGAGVDCPGPLSSCGVATAETVDFDVTLPIWSLFVFLGTRLLEAHSPEPVQIGRKPGVLARSARIHSLITPGFISRDLRGKLLGEVVTPYMPFRYRP